MKEIKKKSVANESNRFYILEKYNSVKLGKLNKRFIPPAAVDIELLLPYLRIAKYRSGGGFEKTLSEAVKLAPENLSPSLKSLEKEKEAIEKRISDDSVNRINYNSLCFSLIRIILSIDKYDISYIDPAQFEDNIFGMVHKEVNCARSADVPEGIAFVAQNNNKKIQFCFDDQKPTLLKEIACAIKDSDKGEFNNICVMIVQDSASMKKRRSFANANKWPRGFFVCFDDIQRKAEKLNAKEYSQYCSRTPISQPQKRTQILSLTAKVKENIPVGEDKTHFKLRFETAESFNIIPGQFIMISTVQQEQDTIREPIKWDAMNPKWIEPKPYLKRPFGIHRAFYKYFNDDELSMPLQLLENQQKSSKDYLKKMSLPPELATVLHTIYPNIFEVFYKVLANGIGTKALAKLQKEDALQILGPLGNGQIIRDIRDKGIDEVHVIGGGVGMAPLIFIVQALRYYSFKVKAFIGIEAIRMLQYRHASTNGGSEQHSVKHPLDETFTEDDPTIYIDDLIDTGLNSSEIFVSSSEDIIYKKIPKKNLHKGFVSNQYSDYLSRSNPNRKILTFACGPFGMMKALVPIAKKYDISLKVLMEKRMACGIGVCLSCVCETKTKTGEGKYTRVCTDGPIFDANEIIWQ